MAHELQSHHKAQPESACLERVCFGDSANRAMGRRGFSRSWNCSIKWRRAMDCKRATWTRACRYQVFRQSTAVFALLLMATALFFSVSAYAQGTTGTLRGQVWTLLEQLFPML